MKRGAALIACYRVIAVMRLRSDEGDGQCATRSEKEREKET